MAASKPYDEKRALELMAKGSQYAFLQIYDHYRPRIYKTAKRMLKSPEQANEIVQEVFMKLWVKRAEMHEVRNFKAFISVMGRNLVFDYLKYNADELEANEAYARGLPDRENTTEKLMLEEQYEEILNMVVEELPPQQRTIFRLAKMEGLSHEAIAEQLNLSRLTVKTHMKQALQTVRLRLQGHITSVGFLALIAELFDF